MLFKFKRSLMRLENCNAQVILPSKILLISVWMSSWHRPRHEEILKKRFFSPDAGRKNLLSCRLESPEQRGTVTRSNSDFDLRARLLPHEDLIYYTVAFRMCTTIIGICNVWPLPNSLKLSFAAKSLWNMRGNSSTFTSLNMQSTQLMSPFAASTWHQTLSQTDGRDKLFRLIQYACKLLRGLDNGRTNPPSEKPSARLFDLERSLGTSRQIWRLFKWASIYVKTRSRTITMTPRSRVPDASSLVTDVGLFGYYVFDNITFLAKLGVLKLDVGASSRRAAKFWLVAVLSGLIGSLYQAIELHRRYEMARKEAARKELEDEDRARLAALLRMRRAACAVCIKYAGDTLVAWSLSKREPLHPAVVGACGTASSFVGLWQLWPKYMPTG